MKINWKEKLTIIYVNNNTQIKALYHSFEYIM